MLKTFSSTWAVGWNGWFADIVCCFIFLNSSPFDLLQYLSFELLNSSFMWSNKGRVLEFELYFWTLELSAYLNIKFLNSWTLPLFEHIKEELKSSKLRYDKRSKGEEFKNIKQHTLSAKQPFHPTAQVGLNVFKQKWPFTFLLKMKTHESESIVSCDK